MSEDAAEPALQIQLLGGFQISSGVRDITPALRLRAARQLIKLLALADGYRLHREQALAAIWPEQPPAAAVNSLNQTLSVARRALTAPGAARTPFLTLRDQQLRLGEPGQLHVDVVAFETLARQARQQPALAALLAALGSYRGGLLPDDPYDSWLDTRRAALHQTFRTLALAAAPLAELPAAAEPVRAALQLALATDPADEDLHRALMRLAARRGDRQGALSQYALLERTLRHDLQLAPEPLSQQLYDQILTSTLAAQPTALIPAPLPLALTSFVGRAAAVTELRQLLGQTRLLTISGVAGGGKTRLALELARTAAPAYPDGVGFVALAALNDPALLDQTVARALGLREAQGVTPREQLLAALSNRRLLLVLDNCEHLLAACAELAETLLQRCPALSLLTTSREPLRVGGELTWQIPMLALPDPRQPPPTRAALAEYPALQLFLDRAAAWAQFALRDAEIPLLVQICARLDGLPIAIELAAAHVPTLSLAQIAARLDDRFALLQGGSRTAPTRQQTLRAAIGWSYDLLTPAEQRLFRRLAVFAGGWTLEAAEAVCSAADLPQPTVLPLLEQLVTKSLVLVQEAGAARRYSLLESLRQYALEQLTAAGEAAALREQQQRWCLALAAQGETALTGPDQVAWLNTLAAELDNFRAALQWSNGQPAAKPPWLLLAYRLYWFWYLHSAVGEGRAVFERALAQTAADQGWPRGIALLGAGAMALYQGELRTRPRPA